MLGVVQLPVERQAAHLDVLVVVGKVARLDPVVHGLDKVEFLVEGEIAGEFVLAVADLPERGRPVFAGLWVDLDHPELVGFQPVVGQERPPSCTDRT